MAIDTPATIAVLGGGPVGLEAALYARYLGYNVLLFEKQTVAASIERWGHLPMVAPLGSCVSKLGLAALHAQDPNWHPPRLDQAVTGDHWRTSYLLPLAHSDLVEDSLREHHEVVAVERTQFPEREPDEDLEEYDPAEGAFRIVACDAQTGSESAALVDVVIDATGTNGHWTPLGGSSALLSSDPEVASRIQTGPIDLRGANRASYAGRATLLVGSGMTALSTLAALLDLASAVPGTSVVWITPPPPGTNSRRLRTSVVEVYGSGRRPAWFAILARRQH